MQCHNAALVAHTGNLGYSAKDVQGGSCGVEGDMRQGLGTIPQQSNMPRRQDGQLVVVHQATAY